MVNLKILQRFLNINNWITQFPYRFCLSPSGKRQLVQQLNNHILFSSKKV